MNDKPETLDFTTIHRQFQVVGLVAVVVLLGGMVFYHFVEGLDWIDALYFCTITLTTIGYGDITPTTDIGKLFTVIYVLIGIGIIATFANLLIKNSFAKRQRQFQERQARKAQKASDAANE